MQVSFYAADVHLPRFNKKKTTDWIKSVVKGYNAPFSELTYVFCSDSYLLSINKEFLKHNTLTDIITFRLSKRVEPIEAEIYISIERVADNAERFQVSKDQELHRVIIHGVLHLIGFKDKKASEKRLMRKTEEACLSLRK
ncbi:MAG: rRNA maturation RNase YbeY [Cyclobacteriaceae bacterium]|nr:rRNA maturation RNase YbeY [Cyclobacteriaceae bacterium]